MEALSKNTVWETENTSFGKWDIRLDESDLKLAVLTHQEAGLLIIPDSVHRSIIHFYFCLEGLALFEFGPHYAREIAGSKTYFFYNPEKDLPFQLKTATGTRLVMLSISLERLHQLFTHESLPILKPENSTRKFYDERDIPSPLLVTLSQLFTQQLSDHVKGIYFFGKTMEILGLYFSTKTPNTESCPFLNDQEVVRKIKHAKEHLLKNIENPPSLKELAKFAGLNEYQLKVGFKEIYGNTVFGYLLDHKLDHARIILDTASYHVNEVAYKVGYTNPSHFIAAFKKKFSITPKKYLMSRTKG
jgi:AraC-like DNA-binding protein